MTKKITIPKLRRKTHRQLDASSLAAALHHHRLAASDQPAETGQHPVTPAPPATAQQPAPPPETKEEPNA